ncbi:uncharacterized protein K489DRAFT_383253 [Dissoconium aciculare CBS 342.82]|uniref:Uncharacterized protein n=1 Tax=Dissoconium aciculare CBS 342.82 TaxID=1314786 RepID=A0A6J3LV92_9PEZI|nr:uncharacterized protein K489DRAFT_383253 [Dissoconium aciculare CBS 342.82]KAF1819686.1 hypothetical protein K489DRAFT_383253 [Dissoconium aciculare CBS 342.82]
MPVDIVRGGPLGLPVHPHVQLVAPGSILRQPQTSHYESGVRAHRDLLIETMKAEREQHHKDAQRLRAERDRLIQDVADLEATCDYWIKMWSECQERFDAAEVERLRWVRREEVYRTLSQNSDGSHAQTSSDIADAKRHGSSFYSESVYSEWQG